VVLDVQWGGRTAWSGGVKEETGKKNRRKVFCDDPFIMPNITAKVK
jgi:hypothetical protein